MPRWCRHAVPFVLLLATASCKHKIKQITPVDPFLSIETGALGLATLSGSNVLLLTAGGVVAGDSAHPIPELEARRTALLETANAQLDSALRRDGREVIWVGLAEQRRAARMNPTLAIDPDRLATSELFPPQVERVPDPLWGRLRQMAALTSARYAVVPAGVKFSGSVGDLTAHYIIVVVDARSGNVLYRNRSTGRPAATPEAALASAAGLVIASPLH